MPDAGLTAAGEPIRQYHSSSDRLLFGEEKSSGPGKIGSMKTEYLKTLPRTAVAAGDLLAIEGTRDLGEFYFVPGLDSHGGDLRFVSTNDLEHLKQLCRDDPDCLGFNTLGFLKRRLVPPSELRPSKWFTHRDGLYVLKERYYYTFYGREVPLVVGCKPIVQGYARPRPDECDMMVILPFFNFANSYRTVQNLLYVQETLRNSAIPHLVVEVAFQQEPFCLAPGRNIVQLRTDSRMFYKENLLRLGVRHTPSRYTKFFFLDADTVFSDSNWYTTVSRLLDTYAGVHGFTNVYMLSPQFQMRAGAEYSILLRERTAGAPGLAWGVTREWVEEFGVFDYCVIGSGDRAIAYCFGTHKTKLESDSFLYLRKRLQEYMAREPRKPGVTAPLTAFQLSHGPEAKRQYTSRDALINDFLSSRNLKYIDDILERRSDGLFEWRAEHRAELNELIGNFFTNREDDSVE